MNRRIRQRDLSDCGPACLASVSAHYGLAIQVSRLRQMAGTDPSGTSLKGMVEAARNLGFEVRAVRGSAASLDNIPLPAIVNVLNGEGSMHFSVIYSVSKVQIRLMDPAVGKFLRQDREVFCKSWQGVLMLMAPSREFRSGSLSGGKFSRFFTLLRPHRAMLLQTLLGALLFTVLGLAMSLYVQKIVDSVIADGNRFLLNLMSLGMVMVLLFQYLIGTMKDIYTLRTGQMIDSRLILSYYQHLLRLPQSFFDSMKVGEISSRIGDAFKIRVFINDVLINLMVNIFMLVFALVLMFTYYWKLALIILLIIPCFTVIYLIANTFNRKVSRRTMETAADLETQLVESLNAAGTIKKFGLESYTNQKIERHFFRFLDQIYKAGAISIFSGISTEVVSRLFTIILLWAGTGYVLENRISLGELLSFYTLIAYFTEPVSTMVGMNRVVQDALVASDRLFEIMDLGKEEEKKAAIEIKSEHFENIRFEKVRFRYGRRKQLFEELDLCINRNEMTGIIGSSGSGKSSLLALLHGLYPLDGGRIMLGDFSLEHIQKGSLRKLIGLVPQQIDLFAGSIAENIALGDACPDMDRILDLCRRFGLLDFIEELPCGFDTQLGERGVNLSGGQRQKIAIARALYRDPGILMLDEATSALDPASEDQVIRELSNYVSRGKTLVVVSHRLKLIQNAARIIVLRNGKVIEEGTHADLITLRAEYYTMNQYQTDSGHTPIKF